MSNVNGRKIDVNFFVSLSNTNQYNKIFIFTDDEVISSRIGNFLKVKGLNNNKVFTSKNTK